MPKPRIIIVDNDENYIIPLQIKFINDYYEKVDLEFITDKNYFDELFSTPQQADILIVADSMYDSKLKRHNISHIFTMTEQETSNETGDLNITYIFKYKAINDIFNEIKGKSANTLENQTEHKETQIIMVYSASGGTGKTTVSMGICGVLSKKYKKVLYINASRMHAFQYNLSNSSYISSNEIYSKLASDTGDIYSSIKHTIRNEKFSYLPPFKAALMSLGIPYSMYINLIKDAKQSNEYDYIVVDTDVVFDEDKAELMNIADKVLIITDQTRKSVYATNILVTNINCTNSDKFLFICNNFNDDKYNALLSKEFEIRFVVNDYIGSLEEYDEVICEDLLSNKGIQKIAFLLE